MMFQLVKDGGRREIGESLDEFIGRLGADDVALFYYGGHGVQVEGENYLIPIDFEGETESDVRYEVFALSKIQDRMEHSGAVLNMLILDACRNNPFRFSGRSTTRGLAPMNAGRGTFVAFATAPGSVADDNIAGPNGLFTQYLLEALSIPGLGLDEVFNLVRARVDSASRRKQLPWTHSSFVGEYRFQTTTDPATDEQVAGPSPTDQTFSTRISIGQQDVEGAFIVSARGFNWNTAGGYYHSNGITLWKDLRQWSCTGEISGFALTLHHQTGVGTFRFRHDDLVTIVERYLKQYAPSKLDSEGCRP